MTTKATLPGICCLLCILSLGGCMMANSAKVTQRLHETTPQDCFYFLPEHQGVEEPVASYDPNQLMENFLAYYFAPWEDPFLFFSPEELQAWLPKQAGGLSKRPGWGLNKQPLSAGFIATLLGNMDIAAFPNYQQPAI